MKYISDQEASEKANEYVDNLRKTQRNKAGQSKLIFSRKGKQFGSCIVKGTGRELEYLACTLAKENHCRVKICRKETYL